MNKNNLIHSISGLFVLLLTIAPSMCFAQKSVTYTFTGRNASSITNTSSKALGLYVSDGTAPKGVSIDNIIGVSSDESENGIDNVDIGNTVGISLIPQYLVRPGEEGVITFKNFLYEIASINWTSRSQVPLLTSKTSTWAVEGDGSSKTSTLTKEWDSNTYETSQFVTDNNFAGISALHISCETTQALHGHSMKDFIISYYEPEITISCDNELVLSSAASGTKSTTVSASITNHPGAFTDAMLSLSYSDVDASVATISGNTITSGTTAGSVLVTATLTYDGTVIATATKKVQIGQFDFAFEQKDLYCEYMTGNNNNADYVHGYYSLCGTNYKNIYGDDKSGLRLWGQTPISGSNVDDGWWDNDESYNQTAGQITKLTTRAQNNYFRACLQRIDYKQYVPAYSDVTVKFTFSLNSTRTSNLGTASTGFGLGLYDFGNSSTESDIWPNSEKSATNSTYKKFTTNGAVTSKTTQELIIPSSGYNEGSGTTKSASATPETSWTFVNANGQTDITTTEQLGAFTFSRSGAAVLGVTSTKKVVSTFNYTSRSKTITYYRYINYNGNGSTSGSIDTTKGTCLSTTSGYETATVAVEANGFIKEDDKYTYEFVNWNTEADGTGTTYNAGDGINIYNSEGKCGAGPITLYAQWKATPKAATSETVSEDDNVYSLWGNGGTINGEEVVAAQFVLGAEISSVPTATRTGYTFNGYYTSTTGGTQIFNASGVPVGDGTIISTSKRWMAENDVYLYAQWTENPSDPVTTITVTLDANGGSLAGASTITCTEGSSENCNIATQTPTRDGYKFTGWYTSSAGNADGDIMVYNANGEAVYVESYSTDSEGNITPVYTALNPTFFNTSGKYAGKAAPFNADFTIYAHWLANTTTMTFNEGGTKVNSASWTDGTNTGNFSSTPTYDEVEYNSVTITRTLNAGKWNTVCFPFNVCKAKVAELFSDVEMFSGLKVEGTTATMLFEKCDVMMPGVPYFVKIKNSSNLSELTLSNVTVSKTPSPIKISNGNTTVEMIGEFNTHLNIEAGALFLLNSKFYVSGGTYNGKKVTGNNKGFRCYFKNTTIEPSGAKSCNLFSTSIDLEGYDGYDGYATDVEQFEINPNNCTFSIAQEEIYDLSGRKLAGKPEKGIYLTNGRKYIAR